LDVKSAREIGPAQVQWWHLWLDLPETAIGELKVLLSADEIERAQRFRFERDRRRYIAARGQLRQILGWYAGQSPAAVQFVYGPNGKPHLARSPVGLEFNLAHSGDLAVVGVALKRAIGADIEQLSRRLDLDAIARRFFAPGEVARWTRLAAADRPLAFFRCWTRKEAYLKARGAGLSIALDSFEVTFAADEPPSLIWAADGNEARWSILDLSATDGYVAAVAVESAAPGETVTAVMNGAWPSERLASHDP